LGVAPRRRRERLGERGRPHAAAAGAAGGGARGGTRADGGTGGQSDAETMAANMFGAGPGTPVNLTLQQAKDAVDEMSACLNKPENVALLDQAKATAGEDAMQYMIVVLPVACNILAPILQKYGFSPDQGGAMMMLQALKQHDADDEIRAKAKEMKSKFIPEQLAAMLAMSMGMGN